MADLGSIPGLLGMMICEHRPGSKPGALLGVVPQASQPAFSCFFTGCLLVPLAEAIWCGALDGEQGLLQLIAHCRPLECKPVLTPLGPSRLSPHCNLDTE